MREQLARTQIRNIQQDVQGAIRYLENAEKNRDQFYKYKTPVPGEQQQQVSGIWLVGIWEWTLTIGIE